MTCWAYEFSFDDLDALITKLDDFVDSAWYRKEMTCRVTKIAWMTCWMILLTKMTWMTVFTDTTLMTHQMNRMTWRIRRTVLTLFTKLDDFDDLDVLFGS